MSIKRKNALYKLLTQHDTAYNEMQYKSYRNKSTKLIKLSEEQYYS